MQGKAGSQGQEPGKAESLSQEAYHSRLSQNCWLAWKPLAPAGSTWMGSTSSCQSGSSPFVNWDRALSLVTYCRCGCLDTWPESLTTTFLQDTHFWDCFTYSGRSGKPQEVTFLPRNIGGIGERCRSEFSATVHTAGDTSSPLQDAGTREGHCRSRGSLWGLPLTTEDCLRVIRTRKRT